MRVIVKTCLSVKTTRSEQSWIQSVWSVGSHQNLDVASGVKAIQLVYYLKHGSLDFIVTP